ncbi:hypothetical protein [Burkholderia pseudomallei]|uniref:hypothetical protein n=1 Tax=Burkholderia pseudomallei TaxID=28450 RepID=UPI0005382DD6|nr:hypothetical protein [Burkholderia pseudomallei]KGV08019.1 hypothetical protein X895_2072 [Burkholderia pseudomallei MSHR4503]
MSSVDQTTRFPNKGPITIVRRLPSGRVAAMNLVRLGAFSATTVSIAIAMYAGWHRGGSVVERVMSISIGCVAVVFVHLLPMGRRLLNGPARLIAFVLWCVGLIVVLYGQVTFVLISRQHAGEQRAATVPMTTLSSREEMPPRRSLTEIARDVAKAKIDLARTDARPCVFDCQRVKVRRTILMTQIATLEAEASEVRRHEAEDDRRNERADREATLRSVLRADPVARQVAPWFGTTEGRLELMLAVACAVVLEGSAIMGWTLASVVSGRVSCRDPVVFGRNRELSEQRAVVSESDVVPDDSPGACPDHEAVRTRDAPIVCDTAVSRGGGDDDDLRQLQEIREAVVAGRLRPTQEAIRKHLRCGQPRAGHLNRLYVRQFGSTRAKNRDGTEAEAIGCRGELSGHVPSETELIVGSNQGGNHADH